MSATLAVKVGDVSVYRNMPETTVPHGYVPAPTDGMWFLVCDYCGTLGNGITGWYGNPTTAGNVAANHDREHEGDR